MQITHEQISARAFKIWEREGKPEGREQEHWFRAEEELHQESIKVQTIPKQRQRINSLQLQRRALI